MSHDRAPTHLCLQALDVVRSFSVPRCMTEELPRLIKRTAGGGLARERGRLPHTVSRAGLTNSHTRLLGA